MAVKLISIRQNGIIGIFESVFQDQSGSKFDNSYISWLGLLSVGLTGNHNDEKVTSLKGIPKQPPESYNQ
jgi:hypothetical protein